MSRFATWGVGDWVMFGIYVLIILSGLYSIVFARRIAARQEEKLSEQGEYDGGGFRPRLMLNDPRTMGLIFLGLGAFFLMRQLAVI